MREIVHGARLDGRLGSEDGEAGHMSRFYKEWNKECYYQRRCIVSKGNHQVRFYWISGGELALGQT